MERSGGHTYIYAMKPAASFKVDLTGVHVFVVDDDQDARDILTEVLSYCGALVHHCRTAEEALAHLAQFLPSIIICDLALPGQDGFAFIRTLRQLPPKRGSQVPAIAISAFYEDFARPEALRLGFNEYLEKPLNLDKLCETVTRLLHTTQITRTENLR